MAFSPNRSFTTKFYNTWLICHSKSWGTAPSFLFESTFVGFGYNSHDHGLLPISEPTIPSILYRSLCAQYWTFYITKHFTTNTCENREKKEKEIIIKSWSDPVQKMGKPKSMSKKAKKLAKKKGM